MARDAQAVSIIYVRALQKSAEILGDRKKLARHLRVATVELDKWMAASEAPPIEVFLRAVALILDEGAQPGDAPPARDPSATREAAAAEPSSD